LRQTERFYLFLAPLMRAGHDTYSRKSIFYTVYMFLYLFSRGWRFYLTCILVH